jgi:hypothetical protein
MSALTENDLRERYELFNTGDVSRVVAEFAPDAVYVQTDTGNEASGRDQIAAVMTGWMTCFKGAQIQDIKITEAPQYLPQVSGAEQCFTVDFVGDGDYVQDLPGLTGVKAADGRHVRLPIGETVWLNKAGQFVRVENAIKVDALQ